MLFHVLKWLPSPSSCQNRREFFSRICSSRTLGVKSHRIMMPSLWGFSLSDWSTLSLYQLVTLSLVFLFWATSHGLLWVPFSLRSCDSLPVSLIWGAVLLPNDFTSLTEMRSVVDFSIYLFTCCQGRMVTFNLITCQTRNLGTRTWKYFHSICQF